MTSIVLELQREAMSTHVDNVALLRKAFFVARKLNVKEFEEWISLELKGYKKNASIPEYREVFGITQWLNPYRGGWYPVIIQNEEVAKIATIQKLGHQLSEIQSLVTGNHTSLSIVLPQAIQKILSTTTGEVTEYRLIIPTYQLEKIQDSVRTIIFDWALKLEEDGIMGNDLSFSEQEKKEAIKHNYSINNFYGNATEIQIQQNVSNSTQTISTPIDTAKISEFISKLKENLTEIGLSTSQQNSINLEVEKIEKEIESVQPTTSKLQKSIGSIKTTLEGAGGNLIASGFLYMIDKLPF